jgi:hypothetical protein
MMNRTIFSTSITTLFVFSTLHIFATRLPLPHFSTEKSVLLFGDTINRSTTEETIGSFSMDERGYITGSFLSTYKGLAKTRERSRYLRDANKSAYIATMLPFQNVKVDSFGLANLDAVDQPLTRLIYCKIPLGLDSLNDLRYFPVLLQTEFLCDPLKIDGKREFVLPADVRNQFTVSITLPDDHTFEAVPPTEVVEMPKNPNNKLEFSAKVKDKTLQINFKIQMLPGTYKAKDFKQFKTLVEQMLSKKGEFIVARKKADWSS